MTEDPIMKRNFFTAAAVVVLVASLPACQRPASPSVVSRASADPETGSNSAGMEGLGAFVGEWSGHGGGVVIDNSGNGTETTYDLSTDQETKTDKSFRITGISRSGNALTATYQGTAGSGTLIFYCAPDSRDHLRGDVAMGSWPLVYYVSDDLDWKKHDGVINTKQAEYCARQ
jgi:hypothetical protein